MAEALARNIYGDQVRVWSAGSEPSTVNPYAARVIEELGLSLADHHSKSVESIDPDTVDVVVTLCAEEVCPAFLGRARRLHWPFSDPASTDPGRSESEQLQRFRAARDGIREKLQSTRIETLLGKAPGDS